MTIKSSWFFLWVEVINMLSLNSTYFFSNFSRTDVILSDKVLDVTPNQGCNTSLGGVRVTRSHVGEPLMTFIFSPSWFRNIVADANIIVMVL